jgi:hypothetical protein
MLRAAVAAYLDTAATWVLLLCFLLLGKACEAFAMQVGGGLAVGPVGQPVVDGPPCDAYQMYPLPTHCNAAWQQWRAPMVRSGGKHPSRCWISVGTCIIAALYVTW